MITIKLYVKKLKPNLGIIMRYLHTNFETSKTNIFFYSLNQSAAMDRHGPLHKTATKSSKTWRTTYFVYM